MNLELWLLFEIFAFVLMFFSFILNALKNHYHQLKMTWIMPLLSLALFGILMFAPITNTYVVESHVTDAGDMDPGNFTYEQRTSSGYVEKMFINAIFMLVDFILVIVFILEGFEKELRGPTF